MQKLVDEIQKKIDEASGKWNTSFDPSDESYWMGRRDGLAEAQDLVLELQREVAAEVVRVTLEQLIGMKKQVLEALEADLQNAVDNDRRMQESVLAEKVSELKTQIKALEGV